MVSREKGGLVAENPGIDDRDAPRQAPENGMAGVTLRAVGDEGPGRRPTAGRREGARPGPRLTRLARILAVMDR